MPARTVVTQADIAAGLARLGINGAVEVHSSLSSFGRVEGGAEAVAGALVTAFPIVMVPTSTYEAFAPPPEGVFIERNGMEGGIGLGSVSSQPFHADMSVSRDIGAIPEAFRKLPGAVRSAHPAQSFAAIGRGAAKLVASQTLDEPLRPIEALIDSGGWVVMLGTDFISCTLIHVAEHAAGRRYFVRWSIDAAGRVFPVRVSGCSVGFNNFEPVAGPFARETRIGDARVRAFPARELTEVAMRAILADPEITLCHRRCARCRDAVAGGPTV